MDIKDLLRRIQDINKKYEQFAKLSGENFNVFSVLGLSSSENHYSLFIAELLNPKGSHGQGDLYFRLFINQLGLTSDFKNIEVITEHDAGYVSTDYSKGGRIDIYIKSTPQNIIIENKIYAGDQPNQLYRYHSYDPNAELLYLTLDGKVPSEESLGNLNKEQIKLLSYQTDIVNWLNACIEKSSTLPIVRETIVQYRNIINKLTNQCSNKDKKMEIMDIILSSEESFNTAKQISTIMNDIFQIQVHMLKLIRERFKDKYDTHFFKLLSFKNYSVNLQITYESYDKYFQVSITPLLDGKWPHQANFDWTTIDKMTKLHLIVKDFLYQEFKTKSPLGYYSGKNYISCIPFNKDGDQSYCFNPANMTFSDYQWLSKAENQEKMIQYAFKLSDQIIEFLYDNLKNDPEIIWHITPRG